jgi:antitoxin (DNA-binding transcriptional repressor) of toxin-antitoxin stability system
MRRASVTEAKNNLSALIAGLKNGSPVLIMDRGRPVARLEPVLAGDAERDERLAQLVLDGLVRPRRKPLSKTFFKKKLPRTRDGSSVLQALLEERREGR